MKDKLGFEQTDGGSVFTLKKGTEIKIGRGQETYELAEDTKICAPAGVSRDGLVGSLIASGAAGLNADAFSHEIKRKIDNKTQTVEVTYDGTGAPRYKVKGSDERPTFVLPGEAVDGEPAESGGAPVQGIAAGVSAGAGVDLTTAEADKLDNPLQSMESDAQLMQKHGAAGEKKTKKGK